MVWDFIGLYERKFRKQLFCRQHKKIIFIWFKHKIAINIKIFKMLLYDILDFCWKIE